MNYVVLDLEFNSAYSKRKHRFVNEIIEFGAVKLDEQLNKTDTFSCLVTPQISKKLNSHVRQLTHITIDELTAAHTTFPEALARFRDFLDDAVLITWGKTDILALMDNCRYHFGKAVIPFMTRYLNLQSYCEASIDGCDRSKQMGLAACASLIGVDYDGEKLHRAATDAELTAFCFKKLYNDATAERFLETADDAFYRKITFKTYCICDLRDKRIDRKEMAFSCDRCGRTALRKTKWVMKNRSFRANFRCFRCKREFEGRVTFKAYYDHVKVIKKIVELPEKTAKPAPEAE